MQILLPHLIARCEEAVFATEGLLVAARHAVTDLVSEDGKVSPHAMDREQRAAHGFAWYATYVEALRQMARWARELERENKFGTLEQLILQCAFGEYLAQFAGGIAMSQGEIARPYNLGFRTRTSAGSGLRRWTSWRKPARAAKCAKPSPIIWPSIKAR